MDFSHTQADDRADIAPEDQFGRVWAAIIEIKSMDFVEIMPCGWDDPLRTPTKYVTLPRRPRVKFPDITRVHINVEAWLNDTDVAERDYKLRLYEEWNKSPQKSHLTDPEQDEVVKLRLGMPSWPSVKALCEIFGYRRVAAGTEVRFLKTDAPVRKGPLSLAPMSKDDRKLLGIVTIEDIEEIMDPERKPSETVTHVADTAPSWKEYLSAAMKRGMTMKQAAEEWAKFNTELQQAS